MGERSIGIIPDLQCNFTGLYPCQSVFATRCTGKISQLLDFTQIEHEQDIHEDYQFIFLFKDRDFEIVDNDQSGTRVLIRVFFSKPTYQQAEEKSLRLKKIKSFGE